MGSCSVYLPNGSRNCIVILSHLTVTGRPSESIKISLSNNAVPVLDTSTKSTDRSLVQSKFKPHTSKQYFTGKFDIPGDADSWKHIYSLPRKVTLDSKTRSFQYKILNNIVYLNHQMFHMKIVSSPLCFFGGFFVESHRKQ